MKYQTLTTFKREITTDKRFKLPVPNKARLPEFDFIKALIKQT